MFSRVLLVSLNILVFVSNLALADDLCPTWYVYENETKRCVCHRLKNWVVCRGTTNKAHLAYGLCMTFDDTTGETGVGRCPYTVFDQQHKSLHQDGYIELPDNVSDLNEFLCGSWNREGFLCSQCRPGYGMAISNVYMSCVKCRYPKSIGWLFYFMLQLIPVSILFFVVLLFRISIVHPPLNAYVTFCQISTALLYSYANRFHPPFVISSVFLTRLLRLFLFGLGIWGMDILENIRFMSDFCVDSSVSMQLAVTLVQIKSLFPLLLVLLTYICIVLHSRNCKVIVYLWRPFHRCFASCIQVWNPLLSIVDVFSTFLLLSYSKFVMVLHFVYSFQHTYNASTVENPTSVLLYNPAVSYYHVSYHLPYALIMLLTLIVVAIPPVLFLAFYQTRPFQKLLTCFRINKLPSVQIFVDRFQSCYKDGINGTHDLRFTASFYLVLRLSIFVGSVGCNYSSLVNCELTLTFVLVFLLLLFYCLVRPYKDQRMNVLDSLLLAGLAMICFLFLGTVRKPDFVDFNLAALILILIIIAVPQVVLFIYLVLKLFKYLSKLKFCQRLKRKMNLKLNINSFTRMRSAEFTDSLPDRVDNPYFTNEAL